MTTPTPKRPSGRPRVGAVINVRLDDDAIRCLDAIAAERDTSRSQVIRDELEPAIRAWTWRQTR